MSATKRAKKTSTTSSKARELSAGSEAPLVSVIVPVYNEEGLLFGSVIELIERLKAVDYSYEIIVTENGSTDDTREIALRLEREYEPVRVLQTSEPNYGRALRKGIEEARGSFIICDEVDILDVDFHTRALDILFSDQADLVVGSKLHEDALDRRPFVRHTATQIINGMLRVFLGFKGTDTHGLKAFRRDRLMHVVNRCVVERDLFASEFVIRAERLRIRGLEIPVEIIEKRPPSVNLVKRVPHVLKNLATLVWVIRIRNR